MKATVKSMSKGHSASLRRAVTGLLVSALLGPASLLVTPAWASPPAAEPTDPVARIQVVVKSVYIFEDHDPGSGEFVLRTTSDRCGPSGPQYPLQPCPSGTNFFDGELKFDGSRHETVQLEQVVPQAGDYIGNDEVSLEAGIPVYQGQSYLVTFLLTESDDPTFSGADDRLGVAYHLLDEGHNWGIGTFAERGTITADFTHPSTSETHIGDYEIRFEIRRAPLPDLRPTDIKKVGGVGGSPEAVCVAVSNGGQRDAGRFEVTLRVDGNVPNGGVMDAGRLAVGQSGELCAPVTLPTGGLHTLSATVDEVRSVPEMNELNNSLEKRFASTLIDTQGVPELTIAPPAGPLPDLQVASLRVARNADGTGTCQGDQSNYVLAQVKNIGQTPAKQFAVRLAVNGNLKQEKVLVAGLPLGATVDVKIQTDDLNDGPQQVKLLADGDNEVAESDENNNSREVTADCD